ncbi:MAG: ABC transporter ATP-binding protein, partial [Solobacterium sp.]|nr:ABC transporter ATP-binding protein [Solobacterium sp.]
MKLTRWNIYKDMLYRLWKCDPHVINMMLLEIVISVIEGFIAVLLPAAIIQFITTTQDWITLVLQILGLFAVYGLFSMWHVYLATRNNMQYVIPRQKLFILPVAKKVQELTYSYYETKPAQEKLENGIRALNMNMEGAEGVYHNTVIVFSAIFSLILYAVFISRIGLPILLALLCISFLHYEIYEKCYALYLKKDEEKAENYSKSRYFNSLSQKSAKGKDIRLYQMQDLLKAKMQDNNDILVQKTIAASKYKGWIAQTDVILGFIRDGITYGYLIYLMMHGMIEMSSFVLYIGIVISYGQRFTALTAEIAKLHSNLDLTKRTYEFEMDKNVINQDGKKASAPFDIIFENVSFQYPESEKYVLKNFNLHFTAGEKLALVGVNGAGKTTIVKLLSGLYTPTSGRILVNGIDLKEINKEDYFGKLGIVFQEIDLFSMTVGENISCMHEEDYDENRVQEALRISKLDTIVNQLPKGIHSYINTDLSPDGINLSGGQQQRLLLAKAYYKN